MTRVKAYMSEYTRFCVHEYFYKNKSLLFPQEFRQVLHCPEYVNTIMDKTTQHKAGK